MLQIFATILEQLQGVLCHQSIRLRRMRPGVYNPRQIPNPFSTVEDIFVVCPRYIPLIVQGGPPQLAMHLLPFILHVLHPSHLVSEEIVYGIKCNFDGEVVEIPNDCSLNIVLLEETRLQSSKLTCTDVLHTLEQLAEDQITSISPEVQDVELDFLWMPRSEVRAAEDVPP